MDRKRLFEFSRDLLCIAGLDGFFKQVNPAWPQTLGWTEEELLSRPVVEFIHPEDRERTLQARSGLSRGIPVANLENRYLCKDGSHRWLSWQSTVEREGATVFGIARDITERRQADQLHLTTSKLESTGILAGGIAHDFNNLLTGCVLNLELLKLSGSINPQQSHHLEQAHVSIASAEALTKRLLALARGSASPREVTDLKELLSQSFNAALSGSDVHGTIDIAADLWPAEINDAQIAQVIQNLVLNARDAMPGGGSLHLQAENTTSTDGIKPHLPAGDYVRFCVSDNGPGIPLDILPKIFDPYFSTKPRGAQKGMGLGLTTCHAIFEKHDGAIMADSPSGGGARVSCYLPACHVQGKPVIASLSPESAPDSPGTPNRIHILVMDDEPAVLDVVARALTRMGYQVEKAEDGGEALALYREAKDRHEPFGALVLDLTVRGGMGGKAVLDELRQTDSEIPALLMTGYDQDDTFRHYTKHGFNGALSKPFPLDALKNELARILTNSEHRKSG